MSVRQPAVQTPDVLFGNQFASQMTVRVLMGLVVAALVAAAWHLTHHDGTRRRRGYRPRHRGLNV